VGICVTIHFLKRAILLLLKDFIMNLGITGFSVVNWCKDGSQRILSHPIFKNLTVNPGLTTLPASKNLDSDKILNKI